MLAQKLGFSKQHSISSLCWNKMELNIFNWRNLYAQSLVIWNEDIGLYGKEVKNYLDLCNSYITTRLDTTHYITYICKSIKNRVKTDTIPESCRYKGISTLYHNNILFFMLAHTSHSSHYDICTTRVRILWPSSVFSIMYSNGGLCWWYEYVCVYTENMCGCLMTSM